jgi:tripartite-type tricarboxylate transporter receptor subunit TctC
MTTVRAPTRVTNRILDRGFAPGGDVPERALMERMMKMNTRNAIRHRILIVVFACAAILTGAGAAAQAFPARPITIVVPYAPGTTDREVRTLAEIMAKQTGQAVVVENREGGGGAVGTQAVARARPDGYTLLYAAPAVLTVVPLVGKPPYSYDDLVPLARTTSSPHVLAARADAPFKTAAELITHARANPGKVVFGSSGAGTAVHLAGEAFASAAGIRFNHVPYRGLTPAITAALGGFVDVVIGLPVAINPQVAGGKLRALAQFGATRAPGLPDIPTLKELGVDVTLGVDIGFFAPKDTPSALIARLDEIIARAIATDEFRTFATQAMTVPAFLDAAAYRRVVENERALYAKIVPTLALDNK